jgi:hypothetical protein
VLVNPRTAFRHMARLKIALLSTRGLGPPCRFPSRVRSTWATRRNIQTDGFGAEDGRLDDRLREPDAPDAVVELRLGVAISVCDPRPPSIIAQPTTTSAAPGHVSLYGTARTNPTVPTTIPVANKSLTRLRTLLMCFGLDRSNMLGRRLNVARS